jgi:hypothetical protein
MRYVVALYQHSASLDQVGLVRYIAYKGTGSIRFNRKFASEVTDIYIYIYIPKAEV